ncbi:MAG: YifB family Mg chelatase-like AAA ATPase, partial [Bacteroidota bacterium]
PKRALEVAAAGGHNVLMIGPPGAGKTMLARRLSTILPPMSLHEALEATKIHSVAGTLGTEANLMAHRPFRSPHHTTSDVALVGGGSYPQPGEISLAHNGVLFLDELPEFRRHVLEVLRQPLEDRQVTVSRARMTVDFPANVMLVASMNPCPCGFYNHPTKACICDPGMVKRYLSKISGPLLDRIDLHVQVTPVDIERLGSQARPEPPSSEVRARVEAARAVQTERFSAQEGIYSNAMMPPPMVRKLCRPNKLGETLLNKAMQKLGLSARAYDRILKVARTIADLAGEDNIRHEHIAEAVQYRALDREGWGNASL